MVILVSSKTTLTGQLAQCLKGIGNKDNGGKCTYWTSNVHSNLGHSDIGPIEVVDGLFGKVGVLKAQEADPAFGEHMSVCNWEAA